jgi:hypothetical protein
MKGAVMVIGGLLIGAVVAVAWTWVQKQLSGDAGPSLHEIREQTRAHQAQTEALRKQAEQRRQPPDQEA